MSKLPTQLQWRRFLCVLTALGYAPLKAKRGASRSFHNPNRNPAVVTFHEAHGGDTLRQGTLSEYLRKVGVDREQFLKLLGNC